MECTRCRSDTFCYNIIIDNIDIRCCTDCKFRSETNLLTGFNKFGWSKHLEPRELTASEWLLRLDDG